MALKFSYLHIITLFPLLLLFALLRFRHEPVHSSYSDVVFNFGDSNSDTGGLVAGLAFPIGPPNGQTYFHEFSGRFCDGRLIIDFLMNAMNLPFLNPYLDSVGPPNFRGGCNFATGGSTALPAIAASISPFSFDIQVSQFLKFKARVLDLLAKGTKFSEFLPPRDYFARGLYTIDIGQNDLDGAFVAQREDQVIAFIPTIISELEVGIKRLYEQGARRFWIHNTGPLGCLPRMIVKFRNDRSKLDEFGCVISHNKAAKLFNLQLHALCTRLRGELENVNVTYIDIFSIKFNLISNYSQFGFKQPIAACCGYGGLPWNYNSRVPCGGTKIMNGSWVTAKPCENATEYINWDGTHYTEAANFHVSSQILHGNYSDPPLSHNLLRS